VSDDAKGFINKLLTVDPAQRLTARQALQHPWLAGAGVASVPPAAQKDLLPDIKSAFNAKRTFKKAVNGIRLINRLRSEHVPAREEIEQLRRTIRDADAEATHLDQVLAQ
jgi:serine/threonine protein kinase